MGLHEPDPTTGDVPVSYLGDANDTDIDAGRRGTISRAKHAVQEATESLYQDPCNHRGRHHYMMVHWLLIGKWWYRSIQAGAYK